MDVFETKCNPEHCEMLQQCPHTSTKNCELELEFMAIAKKWTDTPGQNLPLKWQVDYMLRPLLKQYFCLRLEQRAISNKEIRDVVRVLDSVIHSIKSQSKNHLRRYSYER